MDSGIAKELLDELIPHLEAMESQSAAVLRFLREKGIATEKELAPFLDEAGMASNVRWRASRLRIERLLSSIIEELERTAKQPVAKKAEPEVSHGEETKEPKAAKEAVAEKPEAATKPEAAKKEDANAGDKAPAAPSGSLARAGVARDEVEVPSTAEKPDAAHQQSEEPAESEKKLPQDQKDAA